jgi:hypothetical protein
VILPFGDAHARAYQEKIDFSVRALFGDIIHLKFLSPRVFLVQMTFEFKIKNTVVSLHSITTVCITLYSVPIVLERKYELTVVNLNSKIMSKMIIAGFDPCLLDSSYSSQSSLLGVDSPSFCPVFLYFFQVVTKAPVG